MSSSQVSFSEPKTGDPVAVNASFVRFALANGTPLEPGTVSLQFTSKHPVPFREGYAEAKVRLAAAFGRGIELFAMSSTEQGKHPDYRIVRPAFVNCQRVQEVRAFGVDACEVVFDDGSLLVVNASVEVTRTALEA